MITNSFFNFWKWFSLKYEIRKVIMGNIEFWSKQKLNAFLKHNIKLTSYTKDLITTYCSLYLYYILHWTTLLQMTNTMLYMYLYVLHVQWLSHSQCLSHSYFIWSKVTGKFLFKISDLLFTRRYIEISRGMTNVVSLYVPMSKHFQDIFLSGKYKVQINTCIKVQ